MDGDYIEDVCDNLNVITTDTIIANNFTSLENMIVQNGSLLTINSGMTAIVLPGSYITMEPWSGVLIKNRGTL